MPRRLGIFLVLSFVFATLAAAPPASPAADTPLTLDAVTAAALEVNPQVRAARAQWFAAMHSIKQNYAPADPIFGYSNVDSPTNGFSQASLHSLTVTDNFQFPGNALLQADQARKTADIAQLGYAAAIRDTRAAVATAFYQALLDHALTGAAADTVETLDQVLKVTQVAYAANQASQSDFIGAEFDLAAAQQTEQQSRIAALNDETTINQLLFRPPESPLNLDQTLELKPISLPLDQIIDRAARARQEILEAALTVKNSTTAIKLAQLEYAPNYSVGYTFDNYLLSSAAPSVNRLQDHGFSISFNLPVFFWLKQNEDVKRAEDSLDAARASLDAVRSQTAANVTIIYRNAQLALQTAQLYKERLIPLSHQDYKVALIAYQSGRIDFTTLSVALQRGYTARVAYLQAVNQFLASKIALAQAAGGAL